MLSATKQYVSIKILKTSQVFICYKHRENVKIKNDLSNLTLISTQRNANAVQLNKSLEQKRF